MNSEQLLRRGVWLEVATLAWNVVGVPILAWTAVRADSVALAGFGFDSLLEIGASTLVLWQLRESVPGLARQKTALRGLGMAFWALALYVLVVSLRSLWLGVRPATSFGGLVWLALTFGVMWLLARGKARTGALLGNIVLQTEARVTLVDAMLALCLLVGLGLNALCGWWWADPVASLVLAFYALREGRHAFAESAALS